MIKFEPVIGHREMRRDADAWRGGFCRALKWLICNNQKHHSDFGVSRLHHQSAYHIGGSMMMRHSIARRCAVIAQDDTSANAFAMAAFVRLLLSIS